MKENVSLGYVSSHFLYNLHLVISMLTFCVISFTTSILWFNLSVESLKKNTTYSGCLQSLVGSLASTPKHFCSFLVLVSLVITDLSYFITCIWQLNLWDWSKGQPFKKEQGTHCLCVGHV